MNIILKAGGLVHTIYNFLSMGNRANTLCSEKNTHFCFLA